MKNVDDFFGTMYDFDGDGHTDMSEALLAFQIMNKIEEEEKEKNNEQYNYAPKREHHPIIKNGGTRVGLAITAIVLAIIGWLYFFGSLIYNCVSPSFSCTGCSPNYDNVYSYNYESDLSYDDRTISTTQNIYTESGEVAVPYVGMPESDIKNTSLGAPSENVRHNKENQETANLYDFYRDGKVIFTARCVRGRVIQVWDDRDNSGKPDTPKSSSNKTSKSGKSKDEYDVDDYDDAEDFYYDHYDDFYGYEDAEDYYNEHAK